jgi:hypothetical protein
VAPVVRLKNDRALSNYRKQRLAVFYVIPPGFGRPVRREFGQAVCAVDILAENSKEPIGLLVRYSRTKAGENLRIGKVGQSGHFQEIVYRFPGNGQQESQSYPAQQIALGLIATARRAERYLEE